MSLPPFWKQVQSRGLQVPDERPLDDLTAELTTMLGSTDPEIRDGLAYPALATWIGRGIYDHLLRGLGDGIAAGLTAGLGQSGDDSVFRRSYSALVLGECVARDNVVHRLPDGALLDWGDRLATWYLREEDLRGYVPGQGWAHALAHGADAIGRLASSRHLGTPELTVLLDVLADRLLAPGPLLVSGETDRMAQATLRVLRRDLVPLRVLEPWVARLLHTATARVHTDRDPHEVTGNAEAFLRSLHLQLALAPQPPAVRADLLLVLVDALRASNHHYLSTPPE
ncbi:DUF2785 domain-containing protein [Nocardioides sp.]|uniref:DUF2785 domain-containing protein n=1 Tax=Nocardioides sp. TaxID=35761 RepID=UPI002734F3E7|nr:DUF2785 domain-containing protein [Nocardioides sp.]MDP3889811.1 DUF2785 domain-containing protein [Nocardioides sp.]